MGKEREEWSKPCECGNGAACARFHGPSFAQLSALAAWLLLLLRGALKAVTILPGFDDVCLISNAINQRVAKSSVGNDLRPFGKGQVRPKDDCCFFRAVSDDLE